ncbi:hypothetical protein TL16_g05347 [Triparma laevis f. inornata]|uniref:Uncharacterized protein n=1 Tax=Triparma laevis f. inornata TaxID=1714386 RepID=A0A9W7ALZ0_9STRA|nr:hypothetical protein TL16_g05347 [Triparma laevis f. inornata]
MPALSRSQSQLSSSSSTRARSQDVSVFGYTKGRTTAVRPLYSDGSTTTTIEPTRKRKRRFIVKPIRPVLKGITGFSLSALRQTARTFTGISLSKFVMRIIRPFYRIWPRWIRFFLQPLLIMYYWPLIMIRAKVMSKGYPLTSEKVLKGVSKLVVDQEYVPLAVTSDLGVEVSSLPTLEEFEKIAVDDDDVYQGLEEFEVAEEDITPVEIFDVETETKAVADSTADGASVEVTPPKQQQASPTSQVFSGAWKLIASEEFKKQYDAYLNNLGQPKLVRGVALSLVQFTSEVTEHDVESGGLRVTGKNPKGVWDRVLELTGEDASGVPVLTADSETVDAISYWEGETHVSVLKGSKKYGGGDFSSRRSMEGEVYVCESVFIPNDFSQPKAEITWKFERD